MENVMSRMQGNSLWATEKDEGGVADEGRLVGEPKFYSYVRCNMTQIEYPLFMLFA